MNNYSSSLFCYYPTVFFNTWNVLLCLFSLWVWFYLLEHTWYYLGFIVDVVFFSTDVRLTLESLGLVAVYIFNIIFNSVNPSCIPFALFSLAVWQCSTKPSQSIYTSFRWLPRWTKTLFTRTKRLSSTQHQTSIVTRPVWSTVDVSILCVQIRITQSNAWKENMHSAECRTGNALYYC